MYQSVYQGAAVEDNNCISKELTTAVPFTTCSTVSEDLNMCGTGGIEYYYTRLYTYV